MDAVIFRTHKLTKDIIDNLELLTKAVPNVFVVHDCTDRDVFRYNNISTFNFDLEDYKETGYPLAEELDIRTLLNPPPAGSRSRQIYYNPEYAQLLFWEKYPDFDNYWYIEGDVGFNGDWSDFFEMFKDNKKDLLGCAITQYHFSEHKSIWAGLNFNCDEEYMFAMFGSICRMSKRLIEKLHFAYSQGLHGYYESVVPTLAALNGLEIGDFNSLENIVYTPMTINGNVFKESWTEEYLKQSKNMLFHPVTK